MAIIPDVRKPNSSIRLACTFTDGSLITSSTLPAGISTASRSSALAQGSHATIANKTVTMVRIRPAQSAPARPPEMDFLGRLKRVRVAEAELALW